MCMVYVYYLDVILLLMLAQSASEGGQSAGGQSASGSSSQPTPHQPQFRPDDINVQSLAGLAPHIHVSPQVIGN